MNTIKKIIEDTFSKKKTSLFSSKVKTIRDYYGDFYGERYSLDENGKLNIPKNKLNKIINKINTANDDEVLTVNSNIYYIFLTEEKEISDSIWREDRNHYECVVITDGYIFSLYSEETTGINKVGDVPIYIDWKKTDYVELFNDNDLYVLDFHILNNTSKTSIPLNRFGTQNRDTGLLLVDLFNKLNTYFSKKINETKDQIVKSIEDLDFNNALSLLEDYSIKNNEKINNPYNDEFIFYHTSKALILSGLSKYKEALYTINSMIEICDKIEAPSPIAHKIKGDILLKKGDALKAINCYAYSEEHYTKVTDKEQINILKEKTYEIIKNEFLNIPFKERKLLFTTDKIYNTKTNNLTLLRKEDLPKDINFPFGHPQNNVVYTCHPLKKDLYLPLKEFEQELFFDRVNEFTYLLQCLGATKIEISSSKSDFMEQEEKKKDNLDIQASAKTVSANFNKDKKTNSNNSSENKLKIEKIQFFTPTKSAYIPDNLIWFKTDMSWQRLAKQRLSGNLNQHKEKITSTQNEVVSKQEINSINTELKFLLPKINIKYNSEHEINTNSKNSFERIISVEFKDKELLEPITLQTSNLDLIKYKEDVMFMLEDDGMIDENERKILNRKIKKYGITENEAIQIENDLMANQYSDNELLYIEALKDVIVDGIVTENEYKMLDRYAEKHNLTLETKERINKIGSSLKLC